MGQGSGAAERQEKKLKWWQLSLLGAACTIGTGFFLGSQLAIEVGGPAVLIDYGLAALGTYLVYDNLAQMTAEHPMAGSFRSYAEKAFGRSAGFCSGLGYWSAELLMLGSQLAALSLFSRFWLPQVPMWLFAAGYGLLGLLIVTAGTERFERLENRFAVAKIAAIVMFAILAALAVFGVFPTAAHGPAIPADWLPAGFIGLWSALIFAFYSYGGLEVMGLLAMRLEKPKEAQKAGTIMLLLLAAEYVLSLALVLILEPWTSYKVKESPFVVSLADYRLPFVSHLFNAVLIIAGFSTMAASLFAITSMLVTMAKERDAPRIFAGGRKDGKMPLAAIALTAGALAASVVFALLMPENVYEYMTTAAGLMLLYNWLFILITSGRLLRLSGWGQTKRYAGMALILLAAAGTWFHSVSRPGFFISLGFAAVIGSISLFMRRFRNENAGRRKSMDGAGRGKEIVFSAEQGAVSFKSEIQPEADKRQAGNDRYRGKEPAR